MDEHGDDDEVQACQGFKQALIVPYHRSDAVAPRAAPNANRRPSPRSNPRSADVALAGRPAPAADSGSGTYAPMHLLAPYGAPWLHFPSEPSVGYVYGLPPRFQVRAKVPDTLWACERLGVMCCCIARVCDGVRIGMPREINVHLQQISRLRHGSDADSRVLPGSPVTGRR